MQRAAGLLLFRECPVRSGSRAGRVVGRVLLFLQGAVAGVGWTLGWCLGIKPVFLGQLRAEPVRPPTHRGSEVADTAGVPSIRRAAGAWPRTPAFGLLVQ